jgi:nucleotide-binding universal stress UspA family protein
VDFSDSNRAAIDRAVEIARPASARITLLHVIEEIPYAQDDQIEAFYTMLQRTAEQKMQEFAAPLRQTGAAREASTEILVGRRGPDIVSFAAKNGVDLIVMSSHSIQADDLSGGWATLSYQVSIVCPCSVLLVK